MFIDDRNKENYVDIYPFIDDAKDAGPSARIRIFTNRMKTYFGRVQYEGKDWSEYEFRKFVAAMNVESFRRMSDGIHNVQKRSHPVF